MGDGGEREVEGMEEGGGALEGRRIQKQVLHCFGNFKGQCKNERKRKVETFFLCRSSVGINTEKNI